MARKVKTKDERSILFLIPTFQRQSTNHLVFIGLVKYEIQTVWMNG